MKSRRPGIPPLGIAIGLILMPAFGALGQTNAWTDGSANWERPFWSLGTLPNSSQSVQITNPGWKAVAISASTAASNPASMTVKDLTIQGAWDTRNVLLLNYAGETVPLRALNGLMLSYDARIVNLGSGLIVENGGVTVATNSEIDLDGGFIRTTNASIVVHRGGINVTNGLFEAGAARIGSESIFHQYGGAVSFTQLTLADTSLGIANGGQYYLSGGYLYTAGNLNIFGEEGDAHFIQSAGTNHAGALFIYSGLNGGSGFYDLTGGALDTSDITMFDGNGTFTQSGGVLSISNTFHLEGEMRHLGLAYVHPAKFVLNGGQLFARVIEPSRWASYIQSNGVASVSESLHLAGDDYFRWNSELQGGTLQVGNLVCDGPGANFQQGGGLLVVTNLLQFNGGGDLVKTATFTFSDGTLSANNIEIMASLVITPSRNVRRITNPGFFRLGGSLTADSMSTTSTGFVIEENFGRFILTSNATINLPGDYGKLSFASSSGEAWAPGALLVILGWTGNNAGGGTEQLKFGTSSSGLTPAQVAQIRFRFGNTDSAAKILSSGEVVPDQTIGPPITFAKQGDNFIVSWPAGWVLQAATNAAGPYEDVPGATSPYSSSVSLYPQRFFRLRL